jgi:hypothetical protein
MGQSEEGTGELWTSMAIADSLLGCAPVMAATVDMPFPPYLWLEQRGLVVQKKEQSIAQDWRELTSRRCGSACAWLDMVIGGDVDAAEQHGARQASKESEWVSEGEGKLAI